MASPKGRILCTEDDPDSREMLIFILTDAGYEVSGTESPAEAIEFVRKQPFDLILIDNWMSGMSGTNSPAKSANSIYQLRFFSILVQHMNLTSSMRGTLVLRVTW